MSKPQLVEVPMSNEDPNDVLAALEYFRQNYGDGGPEEPPELELPTKMRHPFLNPDFWMFIGSAAFLLLSFTSFINQYALEPLLFAALVLNLLGLLLNTTRDRQGLIVHVRELHIRLWPIHFGWTPPAAPLSERFKDFG